MPGGRADAARLHSHGGAAQTDRRGFFFFEGGSLVSFLPTLGVGGLGVVGEGIKFDVVKALEELAISGSVAFLKSMVNATVVPPPGLLSIHILPPIRSSTNPLQMLRPRPVP